MITIKLDSSMVGQTIAAAAGTLVGIRYLQVPSTYPSADFVLADGTRALYALNVDSAMWCSPRFPGGWNRGDGFETSTGLYCLLADGNLGFSSLVLRSYPGAGAKFEIDYS
jgi:hypothetical protein